jgi:hypothetical protein
MGLFLLPNVRTSIIESLWQKAKNFSTHGLPDVIRNEPVVSDALATKDPPHNLLSVVCV